MNRISAGSVTKARIASMAVLMSVAGGATALALTPGTASASTHRQGHTLHLSIRYSEITTHFVGKNANKPAIGDEFIDVAPVRANGTVVGHATGVCTIVAGTSEATSVTQCAGTTTLAHGQITTAGAEDSSNTTTDALTGGTGSFAHASGTATTVSGKDAASITIRYETTD